MKKLIIIGLMIFSLLSCNDNKSETIMKNGEIVKFDSTKFTPKFLGKFQLDTYNDKVEVWEVICNKQTYILSIKSDGITMIKK